MHFTGDNCFHQGNTAPRRVYLVGRKTLLHCGPRRAGSLSPAFQATAGHAEGQAVSNWPNFRYVCSTVVMLHPLAVKIRMTRLRHLLLHDCMTSQRQKRPTCLAVRNKNVFPLKSCLRPGITPTLTSSLIKLGSSISGMNLEDKAQDRRVWFPS